jgi:predicted secreted acid phosphatase
LEWKDKQRLARTRNRDRGKCLYGSNAIKDVLEKRYNKKFTFTMYFSDNFEEFEACIYKEEKEEENDI